MEKCGLFLILVLLILTLEVSKTNCLNPDENKASPRGYRYFLSDKACWYDEKLVKCYQSCFDSKDVHDAYATTEAKNISKSISDRKRDGKKEIFGCPIKCMTDPDTENCKEDCQPLAEYSFYVCLKTKSCRTWPTPPPPSECSDCFAKVIKDDHKLCPMNDVTICQNYLDECLKDATVIDIPSLGDCFATKKGNSDMASCINPGTNSRCATPGPECDDSCRQYLPNKYCKETCLTARTVTPFQTCLEFCDSTTHPLCLDSCSIMEKCLEACAKDPASPLSCFSICRGQVEQQTQYEDDRSIFSNEVDHCINDDVAMAKNYGPDGKPNPSVFPAGSDDEDYEWLVSKLMPQECIAQCVSASDKPACYQEQFTKQISENEKRELCSKDPLRIKAMVHLATAGEKSLQVSAVLLTFAMDFKGYIIDPAGDKAVFDKFIQSFSTAPVEQCNKLCETWDTAGTDPFDIRGQNAECYYNCFDKNKRICDHNSIVTVQLGDFSNCAWILDMSLDRTPNIPQGTYFNERQHIDAKEFLEKPNSTQYLDQTREESGSTGYFAFPYFLIVRADCDGGYYDEAFYRLFMDGSYPAVILQYWPLTSKDKYQNSMQGSFSSVLVNLVRDPNDVLVPENPLEKAAGGRSGCHWEICYPGFAVPLIFYNVPIFEVKVEAQDVFKGLFTHVYVSIYHKRGEAGSGELHITSTDSLTTPSMFFPKTRVTKEKDSDLKDLEDGTGACLNVLTGYCPEIEHKSDLLWENYDEDNPNPFGPLDGEDIFAPQYTFLNAPAIAIAGFYNPDLVMIGDPDLTKFDLVAWTFQEDNNTIFDDDYNCLRGSKTKANGFPKPMYSQIDRTDPKFPLKFYRVRYDPRNYARPSERASFAIFEIISLEDRLLLITSSGLVVLYGNTNATVATSKQFKAVEAEKRKKCFKFVRVGKRAQMENDLIIGVTYSYRVDILGGDTLNVDQELWVGKLHKAGEPIEWHQIIKRSGLSDETAEYAFPEEPNAGEVVTLNPGKQVGIPTKTRADKPNSEIEALCFNVYKTRMASSNEIQLLDQQGWCEAIDATPVNTQINTVQILVRMTVKFIGKVTGVDPTAGLPTSSSTTDDRLVVLYIVATHVLRESEEQAVTWSIDSIIPRIPCADEHKESVRNILLFDLSYFAHEGPNRRGDKVRGCQNINVEEKNYHIYLTSLTYTRMLSNHLFVYGTRLLQSADGGQTFVNLISFPHVTEKNSKLFDRNNNRHRIKVMAFADNGHYAFLTNKRELWIGNTGDLQQIRLRPSTGYSMTQLIVSRNKGLQDGIPFTLLYDRKNSLFEMVSVLGDNGEVEKIIKRPVPVGYILRNQRMNTELSKKTKELKDDDATGKTVEKVVYDPTKWSIYCPFSSPKFAENYSTLHSRNQKFVFSPPRQHPKLGRDYKLPSLMAFQASSYSLVWKSFFNLNYSSYSNFESEPFIKWVEEKQDVATTGFLKFLRGDPEEDGVLVLPDKNKRLDTKKQTTQIYRYYNLDYNLVLRLDLTYSIKNEKSLANTDYFTQKISHIQLNVDNANGSLLQIDTEKVPLAAQASVRFVIHISVIRSPLLKQHLPGQHMIIVPIVFHLIGALGNCVKKDSDPQISDTLSTVVFVGCPPAYDILFNWNETLRSIKFRDKEAHYGRLDDSGRSECYDNEFVCFFARQPLVLHFDIFDLTKQLSNPFTGNYIMRVIGGGYTREDLYNSHYTSDEQEAYNIPGVSDVSLIWNEWDIQKSQKIDRKPGVDQKDGKATKDVILQAGKSAVQWACHTLSPCARISPNLYLQTVYFFRISISNRDVDNNTLCLYEKEFDIMLYGFPPSPETQLMTTVLFCLCVLGLLYMLFFCCRGHKRLWRATKVKMYGWYQIVKDTFPRPLKKQEAEGADEGQSQQQKDNIILSLQGHLQVPMLVTRDSVDTHSLDRKSLDSELSRVSSNVSMRSTFSTLSTQHILNPVSARNPATTWTDLVYEQIISKRLTAIVDKNKKMRENILRKASNRGSSDIEQERQYEQEHKRTVSDESLGSPKSKKKDNK